MCVEDRVSTLLILGVSSHFFFKTWGRDFLRVIYIFLQDLYDFRNYLLIALKIDCWFKKLSDFESGFVSCSFKMILWVLIFIDWRKDDFEKFSFKRFELYSFGKKNLEFGDFFKRDWKSINDVVTFILGVKINGCLKIFLFIFI